VLLLGFAVLLGWAFDIGILKSISPHRCDGVSGTGRSIPRNRNGIPAMKGKAHGLV
jgi:hypothetical protein